MNFYFTTFSTTQPPFPGVRGFNEFRFIESLRIRQNFKENIRDGLENSVLDSERELREYYSTWIIDRQICFIVRTMDSKMADVGVKGFNEFRFIEFSRIKRNFNASIRESDEVLTRVFAMG